MRDDQSAQRGEIMRVHYLEGLSIREQPHKSSPSQTTATTRTAERGLRALSGGSASYADSLSATSTTSCTSISRTPSSSLSTRAGL